MGQPSLNLNGVRPESLASDPYRLQAVVSSGGDAAERDRLLQQYLGIVSPPNLTGDEAALQDMATQAYQSGQDQYSQIKKDASWAISSGQAPAGTPGPAWAADGKVTGPAAKPAQQQPAIINYTIYGQPASATPATPAATPAPSPAPASTPAPAATGRGRSGRTSTIRTSALGLTDDAAPVRRTVLGG